MADDRKKIAEALNAEAGIKSQGGGGGGAGGRGKGHRPRASSEPNSPVDVRSPVEAAASSQVQFATYMYMQLLWNISAHVLINLSTESVRISC